MKRMTKAEFLKRVASIRAAGVEPRVYSRGTSILVKNDATNEVDELALASDYPSAQDIVVKYRGWL